MTGASHQTEKATKISKLRLFVWFHSLCWHWTPDTRESNQLNAQFSNNKGGTAIVSSSFYAQFTESEELICWIYILQNLKQISRKMVQNDLAHFWWINIKTLATLTHTSQLDLTDILELWMICNWTLFNVRRTHSQMWIPSQMESHKNFLLFSPSHLPPLPQMYACVSKKSQNL